jgi:NhaP-type Na+/H+ or K+/H+ antiporter
LLGINFEHLGIIGQATQLISGINPNAILAIFLPCLIFESAFKTEWHTFKKMVGQSLIMGVFSSMVSACLIMVIMKVFIDQNNVVFS